MNMIIFLQGMSEGIFSSLKLLKLLGNNVIVFYSDSMDGRDEIEKLRELSVHCVRYKES